MGISSVWDGYAKELYLPLALTELKIKVIILADIIYKPMAEDYLSTYISYFWIGLPTSYLEFFFKFQ